MPALAPNDIDRLKNAQLKQALAMLIDEGKDEPSNDVLLQEPVSNTHLTLPTICSV